MSLIPGLSFSWKRALGVTKVKQKVARATGIPTTKQGAERKLGGMIFKALSVNRSLLMKRIDWLRKDVAQLFQRRLYQPGKGFGGLSL